MAVKGVISLLKLCLFLSWYSAGFTKGQEAEEPVFASPDNEDTFRSDVKVPLCCPQIDLSLSQDQNCDVLRTTNKRNDLNLSSKEWTFPRHMMAENVSTIFQLRTNDLKCKDTLEKVYLSLWPSGEINQMQSLKLLKNGYLKVATEYYPSAEYCINAKNETTMELEILMCPQKCGGSKRPCIKKCCSLDKVYSFGVVKNMRKGCIAQKGDYLKPVFYDSYSEKSTRDIPEPFFVEHYPTDFKWNCPANRTVFYLFPEATATLNKNIGISFNHLIYRIREDGKILFKHPKDGKCSLLDPDYFCIDAVFNYGKENASLTYVNDEKEIVLFLCPLPTSENANTKKIVGMMYGGVMFASSIFLLLKIATYVALWERQSVHGWTIVSHTVALFFMYIFLGVAHVIGVTAGHDYLGFPGCISIGIITHFFFLATFCWLFLISLDLWLTFRAFAPRSGSKGLSRYIKYSIFGWGVPMIFVGIGLILEDKYPEDQCHTMIVPAYGKDSCFPQQKALGVYLYYPIAVLIVLNVIFFAITTSKLYLYRESTKIANKDDKQQFYLLFFKLFFIMGIFWVFEVISWATSGNGYYWYWVVFDMLNVLRALAVFIIFVCKRDIIFALEEKYPCLKPVLLPFAWLFKRKNTTLHRGRDSESSMTRTSTLRQTISSDGKPEAIGLIVSKARD